MSKRHRARRVADQGEQMKLPCRYCGTVCLMAKHLIEELLMMSRKTIEKRGEPPIKKNEIAVCESCRPRYEEEHCPRTMTIVVKRPNLDHAFTPLKDDSSDSTDGFGPPDKQSAMGF